MGDPRSSFEIRDDGRRNRCPALSGPRCSPGGCGYENRTRLLPLYRSTVGFDRLFDMLDSATRTAEPANAHWPPYNIERLVKDQYRITMAVAGFTPDEINVVQQENTLLVEARKHPEPEGVQVLHRGIGNRSFRQTFNLADYVKVSSANLDNGLLTIELVREVPEAMTPLRIEIAAGGGPKSLLHDSQTKFVKAKVA